MSTKAYFDRNHEQILKYTPQGSGNWDDIEVVERPEDAEYHIGFTQPSSNLSPEKLILFSMEPPCTEHTKNWNEIDALEKYKLKKSGGPQVWWVDKKYNELKKMEPMEKTRNLSWVTSDKGRGRNKQLNKVLQRLRDFLMKSKFLSKSRRVKIRKLLEFFGIRRRGKGRALYLDAAREGHIRRMEFFDNLVDKHPEIIDLYGRGNFSGEYYKGEVEDKWDALKDYRYSLAIENYNGKDFWTEKIVDPLLSWCMPIYWGCENISDFLPEDSYVWLDIEDKDAPERVKEIVESDLREENLDAIKEARKRILDEYQIMPTVNRVIKNLED